MHYNFFYYMATDEEYSGSLDENLKSIDDMYFQKVKSVKRRFVKCAAVSLVLAAGGLSAFCFEGYLNPYAKSVPLGEVAKLERSLRKVDTAKKNLESYVYELPYESRFLEDSLRVAKSADEIKGEAVDNMSGYLGIKLDEIKGTENYQIYAFVKSVITYAGSAFFSIGLLSVLVMAFLSDGKKGKLYGELYEKKRKIIRSHIGKISPG